jgi:hypothetical protein
MEKQPDVDARGRLATTAPNDIFKIANETFNILSFCNCADLTLALLETCAHTLEYFQNGVHAVIVSNLLFS